jgi:hypothetical protein
LFALLLAVLGSSACDHGVRPENFAPAMGPTGATVTMRVKGEDAAREGELFAADSIGVIVRSGRLLRVRWNDVAQLDVAQLRSEYSIAPNDPLTPAKRARLALVSRFPLGLDGALLARVLATLKQQEIDEVGTSRGDSAASRNGSDGSGSVGPSLADLAAAATHAAARYAERRAAIADGYRRIGADFPAMGEHWVLSSALLDGRVDPARPTILTFATIDGRPTLLGTGFVMATRGDVRADDVPGWPAEWHEHSGLIAEESGAHPAAGGHPHEIPGRSGSATRVWVLHIWTALENPAGAYRANNWALPFARAGIAAHAQVDEAAGRALSLTVGGDEFLRAVLTDAGVRTDSNAVAVDSAIAVARAEAGAVAERARDAGGAGPAHLAALRTAWRSLSGALVRAAGPAVTQYLSDSVP